WAHAIAPGAKILLVEARSPRVSDMIAAVDYARNQPDVSVVSMSWGAGEFPQELGLDKHLTTPAGHRGITFLSASGDNGAGTIWPSVSPNVLSVGGTTLGVDNLGNYRTESGWVGSGGGVSLYEGEPAYQRGVQTSSFRTNPDVAYNADP